MNKSRMILRTPLAERLCHWAMVVCFFLVALSGLSWVFPSLNWLNGVLGTPQMARLLHPFFGIAVFVALVYLFVRFVKYNLFVKEDRIWVENVKSVVVGDHSRPLRIGKYNAGQKFLFWGTMALICVLLVTGLVIWRAYFSHLFPIPVLRVALLLHAFAGVGMMLLIVGHIYLALWVKGSIHGMVTGYVSHAWARTHHDRWHDQITANAQSAATKTTPGRTR